MTFRFLCDARDATIDGTGIYIVRARANTRFSRARHNDRGALCRACDFFFILFFPENLAGIRIGETGAGRVLTRVLRAAINYSCGLWHDIFARVRENYCEIRANGRGKVLAPSPSPLMSLFTDAL